jgi:transposase
MPETLWEINRLRDIRHLTFLYVVYIIYTMSFIRKIKRGNAVYLAEVENVRVGGKVVQKHLRYVGKEVDDRPFLTGPVERAKVDKVTVFGPLLVLDSIAKELDLAGLLGEYGDYLLSLAFAHCVSPDSLAGIADWYRETEMADLLDIPDISYKKLLEALDSVEESDHLQSRIFDRVKTRLALAPKAYFYDITNIYFYGWGCPLARKGHNPDGRRGPQIQVGLAVTQKEGLPIYHKVYEGNIFDAKTLPDILESLPRGEEVCLVWDRGISSKLNIAQARQVGFHVLCGLALHPGLKKEADKILDKPASLKNRVRLKSSTFYVRKLKYRAEGVRGVIVVCLNERERLATRERRYDELDRALELLEKKKPIKDGLRKYLAGGQIDQAAVQRGERYDGISVIFSSRDLPAEEIVRGYFEKDRVEKSFRCLKGVLDVDKVRFWLASRVKGHIFVCYLAYLLLSVLSSKLKGGSTGAEALEMLKTMYRVYLHDPKSGNKFIKTVTLSKAQEEILKAVDPKLLRRCSV